MCDWVGGVAGGDLVTLDQCVIGYRCSSSAISIYSAPFSLMALSTWARNSASLARGPGTEMMLEAGLPNAGCWQAGFLLHEVLFAPEGRCNCAVVGASSRELGRPVVHSDGCLEFKFPCMRIVGRIYFLQ